MKYQSRLSIITQPTNKAINKSNSQRKTRTAQPATGRSMQIFKNLIKVSIGICNLPQR